MEIQGAVAFVTGANRGLGHAFTQALIEAGAHKVYAAAREPRPFDLAGVEVVRLDVTRANDIAPVVRDCGDVNLLVNNAGIALRKDFLAEDALQAARAEMETHYFGPLALSRAFAPILASNGGGGIVNVLSVLSWLSVPPFATYSASKSAAWSLSNGLRNELRSQGTQVLALHVGFMDTDMVRDIDAPKARPLDVANQAIEALRANCEELLADEFTRDIKSGLSAERAAYLGG